MRKVAVALAAGLLGLGALAGTATAGESIPSGSWSGSELEAGPASTGVSWYELDGTFRRRDFRNVGVTVSAAPTAEGPCSVTPVVVAPERTPTDFSVILSIPCNGTYTLTATAVTSDNRFLPQESATLDRTIDVSAPAPEVTGLVVEPSEDERTMQLSWNDMRAAAVDLSGYVVERQVDDGAFERIGDVGADEGTYTDQALPDHAGQATYRVSSTRPTPGGVVTSQSTAAAPTPFAAAPADAPGAPDGSGGAGLPGTGTATGGVGTVGGGSPSSFPSSLLRLSPSTGRRAATTTTVDGGFNEELSYGDVEPGGAEPVLPRDAMASIFSKAEPGRGLVIPVATALVLAMWAFHLRRLAAAAAPDR